ALGRFWTIWFRFATELRMICGPRQHSQLLPQHSGQSRTPEMLWHCSTPSRPIPSVAQPPSLPSGHEKSTAYPTPSRRRLADRNSAQQSQLLGKRFHRIDHKLDVLGQIDSEIGGAALDVLAFHRPGKSLGLHLLLDAGGGQVGDAVGPNQGGRGDEASQL